jgi:hypothetical protein
MTSGRLASQHPGLLKLYNAGRIAPQGAGATGIRSIRDQLVLTNSMTATAGDDGMRRDEGAVIWLPGMMTFSTPPNAFVRPSVSAMLWTMPRDAASEST